MKSKQTKTILLIKAPKVTEDSLSSFQSFFNDLHKFVKSRKDLGAIEQIIALELILKEGYFFYRMVISKKLVEIVKSLLYAKFKDIEVVESQPTENLRNKKINIYEFGLKRSNFFPLKTQFTAKDSPYVTLSAILSKLDHFSEGIVIQLILRPISDTWLKQILREKFYHLIGTVNSIKRFFEKPFLKREYIDNYQEIKKKFASDRFLANLRVLLYGDSANSLQENFALVSKVLDKYENGDDGDINALRLKKQSPKKLGLLFVSRFLSKKTILLNIQEVSVLFHFPEISEEITNVYQVSSKKVKPPQDLPLSPLFKNPLISTFGLTNFRSQYLEFGIRRQDRNRHLYIIGKTGMGKSKLIQLLAISDIYHNKGLCLIDPHGDLARDIIKYVPKERTGDVIYFNPLDGEYPVGFNPLQCYSPEEKHQVVNGFIAIFKKLFAANWTNRLEHMLRFTVLALVEAENSTVIDIVRILTDTEFRQQTVKKIQSPVVKNFWTHEFASWNEKFDNEAIIPIINIVGQFISNDYIRNVVAQKKSAFDFYKAMNEGKIVIINIAKGILGEDNAALLGSMIITKIQEATMARVNIPENERREFYLYVDEFQNFATESFNQILSEARKFNLSLTIAHQYIDQLSETIRKTVFGNVGSFISFRVGPEDAHYLENEFAPQIKPDDLINLDVREIYLKISIGGKTCESFSANTINIPPAPEDYSDDIIKNNRLTYAQQKNKIEELFNTENPHITSLIAEEGKASNLEGIEFEEPII